MNSETGWMIIGFCGQGFFSLRFLVQWWQSERQQRSVLPIEFWYFSLAGAMTLLFYALHRADPVFVVGQITGLFIYLRNLYLIKKSDTQKEFHLNWTELFSSWSLLGGLWLLLVLLPLFNRGLVPVDETRYLAVAWEMWSRGDWLVPHLNGYPYPHKPPLLFWLINFGWSLGGGVNEWWPRLISGLFSLGSLGLTVYLARHWWPQHPRIAAWAPLILLSCWGWSIFTSAVMFDIVLTFFVLLGMIALVATARGFSAWGLLTVAIGGGILTKGPVMLLHLLPVALIAPWWHNNWSASWYAKLGLSLGGGALIALSWALPAGLLGGEEYRQAIFWGQTAYRLVDSFAHHRPVWWYLPLLPIAFFPWLLWPPLWRGLIQLRLHDSGLRFCASWIVLVFIAFSFVSGKQLHYLLPIFPAFALLSAYLLVKFDSLQRTHDTLLTGLLIGLMGIILLAIPFSSIRWFENTLILSLTGIVLLVIGIGLSIWKSATLSTQLISLSSLSVLLSLLLPLSILKASDPAYHLENISHYLNQLQQQGHLVAHLGNYHGQYQFLGRLQPLPVVDEHTLCPWITQHPESKLIAYFTATDKNLINNAEYVQAYRSSDYVGIIDAHRLRSVCMKILW